ncbi:MAG: DNA-binding protein [Candidatus Aenigmarchaeota archaeon]|nr:DNA-binding protein [Candidatus Aenigmarchaeota archaeon]
MKISDLKDNRRNINIQVKVIEKEEPRDVNTRYGKTKVANAKIEDDTGTFTLVLWGDQAEQVLEGSIIKIENGYVSFWNGEPQLNVGKFGKLTVVKE